VIVGGGEQKAQGKEEHQDAAGTAKGGQSWKPTPRNNQSGTKHFDDADEFRATLDAH